MPLEHSPPRTLLRWPAVKARTSKSRTQAWRDAKAGSFPSPVKTGPNSVAWLEHEIEEWLASRPRVTYAANRLLSNWKNPGDLVEPEVRRAASLMRAGKGAR